MYQTLSASLIKRRSDGAEFPVDSRNGDYREYLAWVKLGNDPLPADPPPPRPKSRDETLLETITSQKAQIDKAGLDPKIAATLKAMLDALGVAVSASP